MLRLVFALLLVLVMAPSAVAQIATQYPNDVGIENDPRVCYVERFNGTAAQIISRFSAGSVNTGNVAVVTDAPPGSPLTQSIQITAPGSTLFKNLAALCPSAATLSLRTVVKYSATGLMHHAGPWWIGQSPASEFITFTPTNLPTGSDFFEAGLEPLSNLTTLQLSPYMFWMGMKPPPGGGPQYVGNTVLPAATLARNAWLTLEMTITMNSPVTSGTGTLDVWLNGLLLYRLDQNLAGTWNQNVFTRGSGSIFGPLQWRNTSALVPNALLLNAVLDTAAPPTNIRYAHTVVATEYIGPISTSVLPGTPTNVQVTFLLSALAVGLVMARRRIGR